MVPISFDSSVGRSAVFVQQSFVAWNLMFGMFAEVVFVCQ